jgi:hypothetical protein
MPTPTPDPQEAGWAFAQAKADEAKARAHPVYPGGPPCNPSCPGPSSMYHDGYADGYENAEASQPAPPLDDLGAA